VKPMATPLPSFVQREFEAYLRCGGLLEGFLRIHCTGCGHDRLVPFSCKGWGFCPSCGGRPMAARQEVFRYQRLLARRFLGLGSTRQAHTGVMVAVQRFGSALNLNIHFHALVLDGVFVVDTFGHPAFMELAPPSLEDLHRAVACIAEAVLARLRRRRWTIWTSWKTPWPNVANPRVGRAKVHRGHAGLRISRGQARTPERLPHVHAG
jgi:Transposase zinc-binding domain/Putative transposase